MIFGATICMEILLTVLGIIQTARRRKGKLKTSDKPILSAVILVTALYIQFGIILGMTLGARSSWVEVTGEYIVTTLFVLCFGLISAIDADITKKRKEYSIYKNTWIMLKLGTFLYPILSRIMFWKVLNYLPLEVPLKKAVLIGINSLEAGFYASYITFMFYGIVINLGRAFVAASVLFLILETGVFGACYVTYLREYSPDKKPSTLYKVMQILPVFDIISMMILLIKYRKISDPAETTSLE